MKTRLTGIVAGIAAVAITGSAAWLGMQTPATATTQAGAADTDVTRYTIDPVHSSIVFRIKHLDTTYVYGRFNEMEGEFVLDAENLDQSRIEMEIAAESIDTNNEDRDNHLRSPDFFNAREHSTLRFESERITQNRQGVYRAHGDLTIHGRTHSIDVDIEHTGESDSEQFGQRKGWKTTFTVDRMDYDVDYMPDGLGHDVEVTVSVQGIAE